MWYIAFIALDEGERIPNHVLGVLCYTARKIRDFLCNWSVVVDAKLAPRRFLQGPTLCRELVGTCFHDAQAPNGQFSV